MTATTLGLGGQPASFLGAYIIQVNSQLGLAQSPSTCSVTLVEDDCADPPVVFNAPEMGSYQQLAVGSFNFQGVITGYERDVVNIQGRTVTVNLSDVREIMKNIPIILAPGYRAVAERFVGTSCSIVDAYGAYDDFDNTGVNLSTWNQAGLTYEDIARAFSGGVVSRFGVDFQVNPTVANAYGTNYRFNLDEVTARVDTGYRVNSNLLSVADLIQEFASRHSFDWYVTAARDNQTPNLVNVTVRVIDRSTDNIDLDLDDFLVANSGKVVSAQRGFELRNELACSVILGAPVESLREVAVLGLANNPIDLTSEGGAEKYFMEEEEMRYVLAGKRWWKQWVALNGGLIRYSVGGAAVLAPLWDAANATDIGNQIGINPDRFSIETADEVVTGRIYDKLVAHAQSSYGKRFLFQQPLDVEYINAAWTADAVAGNNDPNEYFRNADGKTRCYVEFSPQNPLVPTTNNPPNFTFGLGDKAPQSLPLALRDSFVEEDAVTNLDKADWITGNGNLYVAATVEEGNVVKLDAPIVFALPQDSEGIDNVNSSAAGNRTSAKGTFSVASRRELNRAFSLGEADGSLHQAAYQPTRVFLPVKDKFLRYGPVFSSNIQADSEGRVAIDQDDGFSPWEFGSSQAMLDAMQLRVDNASSNVKTVERATITIEGFPTASIGQSIGQNSNINNISISFGNNGVQTTYELRSFLRAFGELSKDELAQLSLFARRGGARLFPQDSVSFINRYRPLINKQFAGRGSNSASATVGGAGNFE